MSKLYGLTGKQIERVGNVVKRVEGQSLPGYGPRRIPTRFRGDDSDGTIPVRNDSGFDALLGQVGWLGDAESTGVFPFVRPTHPGIRDIVVLKSDIADGESGRGYILGGPPCTVRLSNWSAAFAHGQRAGSWFDAFDAMRHDGGPILIHSILDSPYVYGQITDMPVQSIRVQGRIAGNSYDSASNTHCLILDLTADFYGTFSADGQLTIYRFPEPTPTSP